MSRSEKKIMSSIAMTHGICLRLHDRYKSSPGCRDIKRYLKNLDDACDAAYRLWESQFDKKTITKMLATCTAVDKACLSPDDGQHMTTVVMTSLSLGMLSDVTDQVRDPYKKEALMLLHDSMLRVHRYFDPRFDRIQHYATATDGLNAWHRVMEDM